MKNKFFKLLLVVLAVMFALAPAASAVEPYVTYTYASNGTPRYSPTVYEPIQNVDNKYAGIAEPFEDPRDLFVDSDGNVYLVDGSGNKVIALDKFYKQKFVISDFVNDQGVPDGFSNPSGIFVNDEYIYVCDTDANRIVLFNKDGSFAKIFGKPTSALFGEDAIYKPIAMVVDQYDRLFIISSTTYQGVIVMTNEGVFTGFIGAQKVTTDAWDLLWRNFQTAEQRKSTESYIPTEFNNISIDSKGFIYVTTSSIKTSVQAAQIKSKGATYSPVKKLNAAGDEVMKRLGYFAPSGEVNIETRNDVSRIIDVSVGPEGTWSIIDEKRQKVYTYDSNGNLLFAFGDSGSQLGNLTSIEAVVYQGDYMLLLDKSAKLFTVYKRTEYGNVLLQALAKENLRQYDAAVEYWTEVLKRNSNFDLAYVGIGMSYYKAGDYEQAMEYYKAAYNTNDYSDAYQEVRKQWIEKYILIIPVVVIVVAFLFTRFSKYRTRVNKQVAITLGKRTYWQELLFVFHLMYHPFDGFWDLKHEKRGSVRAATTILGLVILVFYYNSIGLGYLSNPHETYSTIFAQAASVLLPVFLWCISNWCLTTLFDGEGSFKDIYISVCYSLFPLILTLVPATLLSNILLSSEKGIISLLISLGYIWCGILLFFGEMVTHDYSMGKNILTTAGTIVGMAIVMFIGILFTSLVSNMVSFVTNIIVELQYRV